MKNVLLLLVFGWAMQHAVASGQSPELYELRVYVNNSPEKQAVVDEYLKASLMPALHRAGLHQVGVFKSTKGDHSMFLLLPFQNADQFVNLRGTLEKDREYQDSAKDYFDQPLKSPAFERINSRLLKAFRGMPVMETSELSQKKLPRVFELRLYESHTEDHARRKVQMFDEGEIQLMKDVKMGPVFFAETIAGSDSPNLVYMLSAANMDEHKEHWKAFLAHPEWDRMKNLEQYKDTVSGIQNWFLVPTDYSDL
ncbi:MAG: NIPSNAP family protein [Mariniblastus sp.]|nr:NIPSNAP family protein [Mariniblastus sp.]